jgi:NAD(P)H-dependent FMN reductase
VAKIDSFDAFVLVTAGYNHGIPGTLKTLSTFDSKSRIVHGL